MSDKNIYQRINAVMQEVKYTQKDKHVSGGGANYKAVTHDQVVSVARAAFVKHGIVIEVNQLSGEFIEKRDINAKPNPIKMGLYSGSYEVSLINIDSPDQKSIHTVEAHANDNGDKAPGKAITYAVKAVILKAIWLETGENEESREDQKIRLSCIDSDQAVEIHKKIEEAKADESKILEFYKVEKITQLTEANAMHLIKNLDKRIAENEGS